jgi:CelD/BcsL family acetyltransferase involved in cellulose biosynthesis
MAMDAVHEQAYASHDRTGTAHLDVIEVEASREPRWRAFVEGRPEALVYHHPAWIEVLAETYGYAEASLAAIDPDGALVGILPMFRQRGLLSGRRLTSLPHTPHAGPIGDPEAATALLDAAVDVAREDPRVRLQIKSPRADLAELAPRVEQEPWEPTFVLSLPDDVGALRFGSSKNHTRIKGKVTAAARKGVAVRRADSDADLRAWYRLYLATMRRHAVPPRPYRFFEVAWRVLEPIGIMRVLLAEQGNGSSATLVAGSVFLMANATVIYRFNGSRREMLNLHPNDAIQWQAIHDAAREGFRRYDFGEVEIGNDGLAMFKSKWGAVSEPLFRYGYPAARELERGVLRRNSLVRRTAQAVWRRLPLSATEAIGDQLYKRL